MNLFHKYMSSASFVRSPDDGSGASPAATPAAPSSAGGGSNGGSSPASSGPSTPAGDSNSNLSSSDLESFGSPDDFDSVEVVEPSDGATPPAEPVAPAPAADPAKPAPAPVAAPADPAKPPVPVATPSPKADASPPSEIETLSASFANKENETALQTWLAENSFKLTKEEAEAFEVDALSMLPKIAAKVQVASMKAALHMMKSLVPAMIDAQVAKTTTSSKKAEEAINEFYTTNSDLNKEAHAPLVQKWAAAFRAQNPQATRQEAIKFVGQAIRTELGLAPLVPGVVKAKPQAFAPARPGARPPVGTTVVEESPFAALGMDLEE